MKCLQAIWQGGGLAHGGRLAGCPGDGFGPTAGEEDGRPRVTRRRVVRHRDFGHRGGDVVGLPSRQPSRPARPEQYDESKTAVKE